MILSQDDQREVSRRTRAIEERTGIPVVFAVLGRSRAYPEATWRGFAAGASLALVASTVFALARPGWPTYWDAFAPGILALFAGALLALLAHRFSTVTRLFVAPHARAAAVRERARALFFDEGVYTTRERVGVLILVCLFERRVELLPDQGLVACLPKDALAELVTAMQPPLAALQTAVALNSGLDVLERALASTGLKKTLAPKSELAHELVVKEDAES